MKILENQQCISKMFLYALKNFMLDIPDSLISYTSNINDSILIRFFSILYSIFFSFIHRARRSWFRRGRYCHDRIYTRFPHASTALSHAPTFLTCNHGYSHVSTISHLNAISTSHILFSRRSIRLITLRSTHARICCCLWCLFICL